MRRLLWFCVVSFCLGVAALAARPIGTWLYEREWGARVAIFDDWNEKVNNQK